MTNPHLALMGCLLIAASSSGCAVAEQAMNDAIGDSDMIATTQASWGTDADEFRGRSGRFALDCPPNPNQQSIGRARGSGPYTDNSSVCTAGVHAGAITFERGGRVVIEPRPGQTRYAGSDRNGVRAVDTGRYPGSFVVVL